MKCWLVDEDLLIIAAEDVPPYKKGGSVVRNSYFWALRAIACRSRKGEPWEFDGVVWVALARMLLAFGEAGYLLTSETLLEFPEDTPIPDSLRSVATWRNPEETLD